MFRHLVLLTGLSSAGFLAASPERHSLMITDPYILQNAQAQGRGAWSFGGLTQELAKAHYRKNELTPDEYDSFIRNWLQQFQTTRPGMESWVTCAWAGLPHGATDCAERVLAPETAPFKLLAISYRPDLADPGCQGQEGEFRFTFGLTEEALRDRYPWQVPATEMTVILEYALQKALPLERSSQGWAQEFLTLDRPELCKDFCPAYQEELLSLSRSITSFRDELPEGVALGQIRTNEVVGDPAFNPQLTAVLRQFGEQLTACYTELVQTPDDFAGGLDRCRQILRNAQLPAGPILLASFALDKALGALATISYAPVPLPLPAALVNSANNLLSGLSAQLGLWEMREFTLGPEGLTAHVLHDTPSLADNNSKELKAVIQEHADDILKDTIKISEIIESGALSPSTIAPANPFDPWRLYALRGADQDIARDARLHSRFAAKTCQGCHSTQTTPNALFMVINDLLLHAKNSRELQGEAARLLRAHQQDELHIANIDAFYMISPLRDPGPQGQNHLAPFLTRKGGHLEKLSYQVQEMARSCKL